MNTYNLVSLLGILLLLGFAWLISADRKNVNWRVILWGCAFQLCFALFIFLVPAGTKLFLFINQFVIKVMNASSAGAQFIFGRLALPPGTENAAGETSLGFMLAFQAFPTIIFFSALISVLYFFKIMPALIRGFAHLFTRLMRISGAESLCAASNIFVGVESALTIKPHLNEMTRSELCTVLTAGMATVSSNILAVYVFSLQDTFPTIAGHLVSASILSAPAAIIMSKLILPESDTPRTLGVSVHPHYEKVPNLFEAVINGANAGLKLIAGIVALLLAVLGIVALLDMFLTAAGGRLNGLLSLNIDWTLQGLFGYILYPFTLIIGVPVSDAGVISKIIGERAIVTEFTAYRDLAHILAQDMLQDPRSAVIAAYALCGFAHIASMAIFVGGVSALAPGKTRVLSQVGFRALIAATLACLMTGCIAGIFFTHKSIILFSS